MNCFISEQDGKPWRFTAEELATLSKISTPCRGDQALGLAKCWADPASMMCQRADGYKFHCP
jgi:hypothetical protein